MKKNKKKYRQEKKNLMMVASLIICAMICRMISYYDIVEDGLNYLSSLVRTTIYIGIIIIWGISVRSRVLNCSIRRYMLAIAALLLFWLVVRSCKFFFLEGIIELQYYCWYGYYIPMILIPLMGIYFAFGLGKTETYTVPMLLRALMIPAIFLALLVLTNNFHQLVFAFPFGIEDPDSFYVYRPLYYVCMGWILLEAIAFISILLIRAHVPNKRKRIWAPIIPVAIGSAYAIGYITGNPVVFLLTGDIAVFLTLIILAVCEACIQSRLIPSNTKYIELFHASTMGAQIVDHAYNRCIVSENAKEFSKDVMRCTEDGTIEIGNERLSGAAITGGYVLWVEDISAVKDTLKKLEWISSRLSENNNLLKAEVELKEKQAQTDEQKRIYDKITNEVEPQLKKLESLLERSDDPIKMRENLGRVCIISAYIKRRGNLILLGEESNFLAAQELEYCLRESMENLRLCGVTTSLSCRCEGILPKDSAVDTYAFFEMILEVALPDMNAILVNLIVESESVEMMFSISYELPSFLLDKEFLEQNKAKVTVSQQEDDVHIAFRLLKEGDVK